MTTMGETHNSSLLMNEAAVVAPSEISMATNVLSGFPIDDGSGCKLIISH